MSEESIAAIVVNHFRRMGREVFQEVPVPHGCAADIVVRAGAELHIVEVKTSASLAVLDQAIAWRGWAHNVSIAVPATKRRRRGVALAHILAHFGLGMLTVDLVHDQVRVVHASVLMDLNGRNIGAYLLDAQKDFAAAGNARGERWTAWKQTMENLRQFVDAHSDCTIREAVEGIEHHYATAASARNGLQTALLRGWVDGIELTKDWPVRLRLRKEVQA